MSNTSLPTASAPTPAQKRRRVDWTRIEEMRLVEILSENIDWAKVLIHNQSNDRVRGATKTGIAREIGLHIRQDNPPDGRTVLQKVKSLKERFKKYYDAMNQTGQGLLISELRANSQLLRDRNRILQQEPWFDMFHQLYLDRQRPNSPDIFTGGFSQASTASTSFGMQNLYLDQSQASGSQPASNNSDEEQEQSGLFDDTSLFPSLDTLAEGSPASPLPQTVSPLASTAARQRSQSVLSPDSINTQLSARKNQLQRKRPYSIFQDSQIEAITQSQQHISDNNLEAIRLQTQQQLSLRQQEHLFMERMLEKMDDMSARRDAQMQEFMKTMVQAVTGKDKDQRINDEASGPLSSPTV